MRTYKFTNREERIVAGQGIGEIIGRVCVWGQFTARGQEAWALTAKRGITQAAVDSYIDELQRIGFQIEIDEEEED